MEVLPTPPNCKVQPGQNYERLTVRGFVKRDKWGQLMWLCDCSCGGEKIVRGHDLRNKKTRSCGCLEREGVRWFVAGYVKTKKVYFSDNQCEFAREQGLSSSGISACLSGRNKGHKGWVFRWK